MNRYLLNKPSLNEDIDFILIQILEGKKRPTRVLSVFNPYRCSSRLNVFLVNQLETMILYAKKGLNHLSYTSFHRPKEIALIFKTIRKKQGISFPKSEQLFVRQMTHAGCKVTNFNFWFGAEPDYFVQLEKKLKTVPWSK